MPRDSFLQWSGCLEREHMQHYLQWNCWLHLSKETISLVGKSVKLELKTPVSNSCLKYTFSEITSMKNHTHSSISHHHGIKPDKPCASVVNPWHNFWREEQMVTRSSLFCSCQTKIYGFSDTLSGVASRGKMPHVVDLLCSYVLRIPKCKKWWLCEGHIKNEVLTGTNSHGFIF